MAGRDCFHNLDFGEGRGARETGEALEGDPDCAGVVDGEVGEGDVDVTAGCVAFGVYLVPGFGVGVGRVIAGGVVLLEGDREGRGAREDDVQVFGVVGCEVTAGVGELGVVC